MQTRQRQARRSHPALVVVACAVGLVGWLGGPAAAAELGGIDVRMTTGSASGTDASLFLGNLPDARCPAGTGDSLFTMEGPGLRPYEAFLGPGNTTGTGPQEFSGASVANLRTSNAGSFVRSGPTSSPFSASAAPKGLCPTSTRGDWTTSRVARARSSSGPDPRRRPSRASTRHRAPLAVRAPAARAWAARAPRGQPCRPRPPARPACPRRQSRPLRPPRVEPALLAQGRAGSDPPAASARLPSRVWSAGLPCWLLLPQSCCSWPVTVSPTGPTVRERPVQGCEVMTTPRHPGARARALRGGTSFTYRHNAEA